MATYASGTGWGYWPDRPSKPKQRSKVEVTKRAKNGSYAAVAKAAEELCEEYGVNILDVKVRGGDYSAPGVYAYVKESDEAFQKRVRQFERDLAVWEKSNEKRKALQKKEDEQRKAEALVVKAKEEQAVVQMIASAIITNPSLAKKALKIIEENK